MSTHHTCGSRKGIPVLPIGKVNLVTGKCVGSEKYWDEVWECWEENASHSNMLLQNGSRYYVAHTTGKGYPPGDTFHMVHDQTNRWIGPEPWTILACEPHTKEGLKKLAEKAGKKTITMATFK